MIKMFNWLPEDAKMIREEVFVKEQGFCHEFDETDNIAVHFVLYNEKQPAGTCRIFKGEEAGVYILGRLAVMKECRGLQCGKQLVQAAEAEIRKHGGVKILLHAQVRVQNFYEKAGYKAFGQKDMEEICPHIWMAKEL